MKYNTLLSTKESAKITGLSQDHIRRLLETRQIKGRKIGNSWVVLELSYQRKRKPKTTRKGET